MYICMKCNRTFADPAAIYDDVGYKYSACPYCEDDRIEESEPCKQCSDPKPKDHEDYCDSCKGAVLEAVIQFVHDMRMVEMWDNKLVIETMKEYLRED